MSERAKKSFGQHFLKGSRVPQLITAVVSQGNFPLVVEVGPGRGALTDYLVPLNSALVLVEADRDFIDDLRAKYPRAEVVQGDAAQVDYDVIASGADRWMLVGNLPYNASAAIVNQAMAAKNPPQELVIMVQKEQAQRMRAKPGEMGLLSIVVQLDYATKKVTDVPPEEFSPKPKVDSTVLHLIRKEQSSHNREQIIKLAKIGFAARRKQLHKNLASAGFSSSEEIKQILRHLGLSETVRAQELSVEDWVELGGRL